MVKLEAVRSDALYATSNRAVYRLDLDGTTQALAHLPNPASGWDRIGVHLRTTGLLKRPVAAVTGRFPAVNIAVVDDDSLVATTGSWVFSSTDGGKSWQVVDRLPDSSGPMGVLPSAVCVHDGGVYLGEYPLGEEPPRVRKSVDAGRTWETVTALPGVRHVHAVRPNPYRGDLWVTTGDRDAECYIGRLRDGVFEPVGGGSQEWRAVEPVFTPEYVIWGVDCNYAETKRVYRLAYDEVGKADPDPTPVASLQNPVFYAATVDAGDERWVVLSTAASASGDSTAPGQSVTGSDETRVVAASSASEYTQWIEVAAFARDHGVGERLGLDGVVPATNAYTFLETNGKRLFMNPYNTREHHGRVLAFGAEHLEELANQESRRLVDT